MRQRDADLGVDVHDEAGAVEAGRARAAPDVGNAEVLHRDADDAAVAWTAARRASASRRRRLEHERRVGSGAQRSRSCACSVAARRAAPAPAAASRACRQALGGLEAGDLVLDRREQAAALGELALDRLRAGLRGRRRPAPAPPSPASAAPCVPDLRAEALHLAQDARVLGGDPLDGVEPVEEVVDRLGAEQHLERRPSLASDVQRDEPLGRGGSGRSSGSCARSPGGARSSAAPPRSCRASSSRGCTPRPRARAASRSPGSARGRSAPRPASTRSGSAEAVFTHAKATATTIAVRAVRSAGALRLLELIKQPSARTRPAPRWGPGPSQVGHPSRPFGRPQRPTEPKTACPTHVHESQTTTRAAQSCYGPRPRGGRLRRGGAARLAAVLTASPCWRPFRSRSLPTSPVRAAGGPVPGGPAACRHRLARRARERRDARALRARERARRAHGVARRPRRPPDAVARERAAARRRSSESPSRPSASPSRSSRRSSGLSTSSRTRAIRSQCCSAPTRSTRLSRASTASAGPPARATGSSSRRAKPGRSSRALGARLAEQAAELDALVAPQPRRTRQLAATAAARRSFVAGLRHQQRLNAARIAAIEAQARTADQQTRGRDLRRRRPGFCRRSRPSGARSADDHRLLDRLFHPRAHVDRDADRCGRRRGRSSGDPAWIAADDPGLRHGHRRRHRRVGARKRDRPLVPDPAASARLGPADSHDHASTDD